MTIVADIAALHVARVFAGSDEAVVAALAAANDRIVVDAADIFPAPAEVAEFTFTGVFDMQR